MAMNPMIQSVKNHKKKTHPSEQQNVGKYTIKETDYPMSHGSDGLKEALFDDYWGLPLTWRIIP